MSTAISVATTARNQYVPHGRNELHTIFDRHFGDFCAQYDEKYAATYGRYRLERIQQLGEQRAKRVTSRPAVANGPSSLTSQSGR